jgi:hypothetical protein
MVAIDQTGWRRVNFTHSVRDPHDGLARYDEDELFTCVGAAFRCQSLSASIIQ